ncbi:MAG: hypothetical protein NZ736_00480 [Candidatus Poseidoniaceae archaeon]|nr:hypothetical protein [Candidatus Poseidoniaceae archaeon]
MAGLRRKIATMFGVAILVFVFANVQLGIVAPAAIDGAPNSKIDVLKMTEPHCSFDEISDNLKDGGQSYCIGSTGDWDGADLIMFLEGLVLIFAGRFKLPKGAGWMQRSRKLAMATGGVLFFLAVLDRLLLLPTPANSTGLAELMPINVSPWMIQIGIAIIGAALLRGPKYWDSEAQQITQTSIERRRVVADQFRSTFNQHPTAVEGDSVSLSRTSKLLRNDHNLLMQKSRYGVKVFATCPYCAGAGCNKCGKRGIL